MKKLMLVALWLPLITIAFLGCKKNTNTITAPYQVRTYPGNYQFGGMIDGREFIPTGYSLFGTINPVSSLLTTTPSGEKDFYCGMIRYEGTPLWEKAFGIEFYVKNFNGVGFYAMKYLTSPYPYVYRSENYGGYKIEVNIGSTTTYFLTNNLVDTGFVECKKWNGENDFEFAFKYICRNSTVGDTTRATKTIEGTVIRKP